MEASGHPIRSIATYQRAVPLVTILLTLYALAYIDRQIINLLVEPLQTDLGITDIQISFLQGFAFVTFYTLFGLPLGYLVDRYSRRMIIFVGVLFWSLASFASGLAQSYDQLLMARFAVGAGEAALLPAAYSLIGDAVSRQKLSRAISIFSIGAIIGGSLALTAGGYLVKLTSELGGISLPFIGELSSWQFVFIVIGLCGVPFSLLIFLVPEPIRATSQLQDTDHAITHGRGHVREHIRFYLCHMAGFSLMCLVMAGNAAWQPAFMQRQYGWDIAKVGLVLGVLHVVGGIVGILGSGYLADFLQNKGYKDAHLRLYLFVMPALAAAATLGYLSTNLGLTLVGLTIVSTAGPFIAVAASGLALATPSSKRGIMSGFFLLCYNIIGFGAGPTVVAFLSNHLKADGSALGVALALTFLVITPIVLLCFYFGLKPMRVAVSGAGATEALR